MSQQLSRVLILCGSLAVFGSGGIAWGQAIYDPCCIQPVQVQAQACYHTVPVTEIRQVRQTVQRPVIETAYVDQPVTEYRQVVENKVAQIPTISYQNVTECQTVQHDLGRWVTQYETRPQMHPCEYDNRPDLFGWMNRTNYSLRMAFTPQVKAQRVYVPNVVTQAIPVTRQVAIQGTKTVNYQVSRMVPYTTTRKVAVNTVRMVAQEVVTQHPVTVMRTIQVGSPLALAPTIAAPAATALQPVPERSANRLPAPAGEDRFDSREAENKPILPRTKPAVPAKPTATTPGNASADYDELVPNGQHVSRQAAGEPQVASTPSAVRVGRWVARRTTPTTGPSFPETIVAGTEKIKR